MSKIIKKLKIRYYQFVDQPLNNYPLFSLLKYIYINIRLRINDKLKMDYLQYFGGFQYSVHQKLNKLQLCIYYLVRFASIKLKPYIEKHPSWLYSSGIIGIFSKE